MARMTPTVVFYVSTRSDEPHLVAGRAIDGDTSELGAPVWIVESERGLIEVDQADCRVTAEAAYEQFRAAQQRERARLEKKLAKVNANLAWVEGIDVAQQPTREVCHG